MCGHLCATVQVAAFVRQFSLSSLHRIDQSLVTYISLFAVSPLGLCAP